MVKNWLLYILVLIVTLIFFIFYRMWLSWFLLICVLACPLLSLGMFIGTVIGYEIKAETPVKVSIGKASKLTIRGLPKLVLASSRYKAYLEIKDLMTEKKTPLILKGQGNIEADLKVNTAHCGCIVYNIAKLRVYDMLGLFFWDVCKNSKCEVFIRPVPINSNKVIRTPDSKTLVKTNSPSAEVYEIREYVEGDSPKRIHWKASAKKDMLLSKECYDETNENPIVRCELSNNRHVTDDRIGTSYFDSIQLLNKAVTHKFCVVAPNNKETLFLIKNYKDLDAAILKILSTDLLKEEPA